MCDRAFEYGSKAASACVLLNHISEILDGIAKSVYVSSPVVAEALVVRNACFLMAARGLMGLPICSDSNIVIFLASSDLELPWEITAIISDIRSLVKDFGFTFIFIPRSCNLVARWIVKSNVKCWLTCN